MHMRPPGFVALKYQQVFEPVARFAEPFPIFLHLRQQNFPMGGEAHIAQRIAEPLRDCRRGCRPHVKLDRLSKRVLLPSRREREGAEPRPLTFLLRGPPFVVLRNMPLGQHGPIMHARRATCRANAAPDRVADEQSARVAVTPHDDGGRAVTGEVNIPFTEAIPMADLAGSRGLGKLAHQLRMITRPRRSTPRTLLRGMKAPAGTCARS